MRTRSEPTPRPLKVLIVLWTLNSLIQLALVSRFPQSATSWAPLTIAAALAYLSYNGVALWRLSRWPILLQVVGLGASLTGHYLSILGPKPDLTAAGSPLFLYLVLTLLYWNRMNWGPLGRPYRPIEDQAAQAV